VLATNKIYNDGSGTINIHRAFEDFKMWMPQSTKAEKPMMHISLNPHPDDRLSDAEYAQLAHEYMDKMGFADMPYLIVKHEDIDRHHIHIVALRVRTDGTAISTKNNFYKSKEITRELEKKYGLHTAERQKITPDMPINKVESNGDVKRQVAMAVKLVGMRYKFQTIGEYNAILSLYNVRCEEADGRYNGREYHGLVYFAMDDSGKTVSTPFKASRLGKFAGREAIDQRYQKAKESIDVKPTLRTVRSVMSQSSDKYDFIAKLKAKNIDLILRFTDDGRIYGATYIDHNTKTVLNGSRLGKEFSANALDKWFKNPDERPVPLRPVQQSDDTTQGNTRSQASEDSGNVRGNTQSHSTTNHSQSNDYDYTPSNTVQKHSEAIIAESGKGAQDAVDTGVEADDYGKSAKPQESGSDSDAQ